MLSLVREDERHLSDSPARWHRVAVSGPAWEVGGSWAGRRYLEDTARIVAVTLLTLTPENASHVAIMAGKHKAK